MSGKAPLAGPAANTLEASSSRLALSLSIPQPGVCYPGQTLYAAVRFKGDTKYEKLSLKLKAETPLRVWGKDRWVRLALLSYPALRHLLIIEVRLPDPSTLFAPVGFTLQQAGAVASATLGGGGGVPVTNLERWTFVDLDIPLTSSGRHDIGDDKRKHPGSSHSHPSPEEGVYEFVVPLPPDGQVLPSLPAIAGAIDGAQCCVVWTLELEGTRHGWYRSNDKLTLELPVVMPIHAPAHPPEVQAVKGLKFQGQGGQNLNVATRLVCNPPSIAQDTLRYRLSLKPTDSVTRSMLDSAFSSSSVKTTASLARQVRTAPMKAENGQDFHWAATRVAGGTLERAAATDAASGTLEWTGELVVPPGQVTVQSTYLDVNFILNCHLRSSIFPNGDLHLSLPVILPSIPPELASRAALDAGQHEQQPAASGSALPPYEP